MKTRDLFDLVLLGMLWGASFLFMRVAVPEFGPVPLIEIRVAVGAAFLLTVLAWRGGLKGLLGKAVPLTVVGAINSALPFSLFAFATLSLTAGFAAVLNATAPLFGALVAYLWLRETMTSARVLGLGVGFVGVLVLVWGKISFKDDGSGWALLAGLAASLAYGIAANYTRRQLSGVDPVVTATGSQIAAAAMLLPLAALYWPAVMPSALSWFSVIALGIACTGIAYILYFRLIAQVGPATAITVTYLVPVFGMIWGLLFLHEAITPTMIAGFAVILLGTTLATGTLAFGARPAVVENAASNGRPVDNLKTLGIAFGDLPKPGGSYVTVNIRANIAYVAIQFPIKEGKFLFTGRLGKDITTQEGYEAARLAAINVLGQIDKYVGFEKIVGLNHADIYYLADKDWNEGPTVANGASDLFLEVLGDLGQHTRAIFGVDKLPRGACVALTTSFTIKDKQNLHTTIER